MTDNNKEIQQSVRVYQNLPLLYELIESGLIRTSDVNENNFTNTVAYAGAITNIRESKKWWGQLKKSN